MSKLCVRQDDLEAIIKALQLKIESMSIKLDTLSTQEGVSTSDPTRDSAYSMNQSVGDESDFSKLCRLRDENFQLRREIQRFDHALRVTRDLPYTFHEFNMVGNMSKMGSEQNQLKLQAPLPVTRTDVLFGDTRHYSTVAERRPCSFYMGDLEDRQSVTPCTLQQIRTAPSFCETIPSNVRADRADFAPSSAKALSHFAPTYDASTLSTNERTVRADFAPSSAKAVSHFAPTCDVISTLSANEKANRAHATRKTYVVNMVDELSSNEKTVRDYATHVRPPYDTSRDVYEKFSANQEAVFTDSNPCNQAPPTNRHMDVTPIRPINELHDIDGSVSASHREADCTHSIPCDHTPPTNRHVTDNKNNTRRQDRVTYYLGSHASQVSSNDHQQFTSQRSRDQIRKQLLENAYRVIQKSGGRYYSPTTTRNYYRD